jgi:uncharacterized membrane protein
VTGTNPARAPQDTTLDVHVLGSGFDRGSSIDFLRDGVVDPKLHVNKVTYKTGGELIANVTITADAETVPYDVAVTTSKGKKGIGTELFIVEVKLEVLVAPSGASNVSAVGPTGLVAGTISTRCGPGFAPALWDQARQLTALPALAGTCGGVANAVNATGMSVGSAYTASTTLPVRWIPSPGGYAVEQLPALPDGSDPGPTGINASGAITSGNAAAVWTQATGWQMMTKPSGATACIATFINDSGAMTAHCLIGGQSQGVFWETSTSSPIVLPLPSGSTSASPFGINGSAAIVGFTRQSNGSTRAVKWTNAGGTWTVQTLGDLGAGGSAHGINDSGQIAGSVNAPSGTGYVRPAYWEADGTLHLLESTDGVGEAVGLSNAEVGVVFAGYVRAGKGGGSRVAVRWVP